MRTRVGAAGAASAIGGVVTEAGDGAAVSGDDTVAGDTGEVGAGVGGASGAADAGDVAVSGGVAALAINDGWALVIQTYVPRPSPTSAVSAPAVNTSASDDRLGVRPRLRIGLPISGASLSPSGGSIIGGEPG